MAFEAEEVEEAVRADDEEGWRCRMHMDNAENCAVMLWANEANEENLVQKKHW